MLVKDRQFSGAARVELSGPLLVGLPEDCRLGGLVPVLSLALARPAARPVSYLSTHYKGQRIQQTRSILDSRNGRMRTRLTELGAFFVQKYSSLA